jgi:hypothetical protein
MHEALIYLRWLCFESFKVPNGSSGTPLNMKTRSKTVDLDNDAGVMNDLEGESDGQSDPMDEEVRNRKL